MLNQETLYLEISEMLGLQKAGVTALVVPNARHINPKALITINKIQQSNHSKPSNPSFPSLQSFIIAVMSFFSSQNLRQNITSDDRLVDFARKSAKPYSSDPKSSTPRTTIDNRDSSISWQQKYQRARGLFNQQSVVEKWEEEQKSQAYKKSEARTNNENNQSQPLESIMKNIPEPTNYIFKTNRNLDQYPNADEPNRQSLQHGQNLNVSQINISLKPMNEIQQHYFNAMRSDREDDVSQLDSSENFFEVLKKKALKKEEKQSNAESQESQNIFEAYHRKSKPPSVKDDTSSDQSDDENMFENYSKKPKEERKSLIRSQEVQKYPLEKILQSSKLYHNYLVRTSSNDKKLLKKFSLDIPQLKETYMPNMKIPQYYFFKPERVQFKKLADELIGQASYNGNQYLCKVNTQRSSFYYQDLRSQQLKNLNGVKSSKISLDKNDRISPHTEYDHIYQRFYLFSNKQQAILVYSQLSMELLCKVPVQKHIINPNLHFCQINGRNFLMLVGGYISVEKQIAQGNNFIQIFQVNKWFLDLRSRVIKLIIGRINPIFISLKDKKEHLFLILGGNTIARVSSFGVFDFQYEKEINQSTNMTGISIDCREITQLFDYDEHTSISNLSVKLEDPFLLHSGVVLTFSNNFLLVLPHSLNLFQIKISNKEINIIEARAAVFFHTAHSYQKRELSLKIERENLIVYRIDDRGVFNIQSHQGKKVEKCFCQLY